MVCVSALGCLSQHLPSYLGFSYLELGVSLHCCSSKAQLLLLILDEGYLIRATPPDIERLQQTVQKHASSHAPCRSAPAATHCAEARWLLRTTQKHGREDLPVTQGQGQWPRGATPRPRSEAAAESARQQRPRAPGCDSAGAAERSYPTTKE